MSRRHLESALVAGALIESGLKPCFRFTRIRFVRYCFPPGYDSNRQGLSGRDCDEDEYGADGEAVGAFHTASTTCTCCPVTSGGNFDATGGKSRSVLQMLGEGDCIEKPNLGTVPCQLHMAEYLRKRPWRRLQDDYAVHSVQFSPDGQQLLAGSANTSIRVIKTSDGSQRLLPRPSKWQLGMPITAIRFMPPKLIWAVACNSHGEVFAFNPEHEGFETLFTEPQQTYALDFSPDGTELATGGVDRKIRIYTLRPGAVVGLPTVLSDPCGTEASLYPRSRFTAKRIEASTQQFYNRDLPNETRLSFPGGRPDQIVDVTVKPYTLTRCYGTPDLLDSPSLPEPCDYVSHPRRVPPLREYVATSPGMNITEGHSKRIMALRFHPRRSSVLFSAGWDNLVKMWDTRLPVGPVWQVYGPHVASPDGLDVDDNYLLTASWRAKNSIELWDIRTMNSSTNRERNKQLGLEPQNPPPSLPQRPVTANGDPANLLGPVSSRPGCPGYEAPEICLPPSNGHTAEYWHSGPAESIPIAGPNWVAKASREAGEYAYAARLLPSRAVVAAGSGFLEVRIVGRDTMQPVARIPVDSVVQSLDSILEGRYIGAGCASGTVSLIGMA